MFYVQLERLCKQNHTTPTAVTVALGMSKGTMSNWKKGATPNGEAIVRFAEHFNVSTDYLLTGKEPIKEPKLEVHHGLSKPDERELMQIYNSLDDIYKGRAIEKLSQLAEQNAESKKAMEGDNDERERNAG